MYVIFDRTSRRVYSGTGSFDTPLVSQGFYVMMFTEYVEARRITERIKAEYNAGGLSATRPLLDLTIVKPAAIRGLMKWSSYDEEREREAKK